MSLGGDFYALEQRHLAQILAGELDFFEFYEKTAAQDGPKAVFSEGEDAWHWLQLRFEALGLDILGVHETGLIPEAAFFSSAIEVQALAAALGQLSEQQLSALADLQDLADADFYHAEYWLEDAEPDEALMLLQALVAFYQHCAAQGWALLYRMT